ncbi:hypothetical protein ACROYT_G015402 [Oculina patagonica]
MWELWVLVNPGTRTERRFELSGGGVCRVHNINCEVTRSGCREYLTVYHSAGRGSVFLDVYDPRGTRRHLPMVANCVLYFQRRSIWLSIPGHMPKHHACY